MAITLDKYGFVDIENRDVAFRGGSPTNPEGWEMFKSLPEWIKRRPLTVSRDAIENTWNPVIDICTGIQLHSSFDRFKIWCMQNKIVIIDDPSSLFITMKYKHYIPNDKGDGYMGYYEYLASLEGMPVKQWLEENE